MVRSTELREKEELLRARKQESAELSVELANTGPRRKRGRRRQAAQRGIRGKAATGQGYGDPEKVCTQHRGPTEEEENKRRNGEMRACIITTRTASLQTQWHEERGVKKETARQLLARRSTPPIAKRSLARTHWSRSTRNLADRNYQPSITYMCCRMDSNRNRFEISNSSCRKCLNFTAM